MKKILPVVLVTAVTFLFGGCSDSNLEFYKGTEPKADVKEYFDGPIKAWGVVQDWRGRVTRRFDVDMVGSWEGDNGTLEEEFHYYDGEKQRRVWKIVKLPNGEYEGRASDIIDKATGKSEGAAIQWAYVMDVPVDKTSYRLTFDDRMWLMNDGVLINRSYLKKFGFTVAELTIFMQKRPK